MLSKGGLPRLFWDMISLNFNYILINYACLVYMKHWIPMNFAWFNWHRFRKNLFFHGDEVGNIWSAPFLHWFLNTFPGLSMYWMWLGVNRRSRSLQIERNISIDICQSFIAQWRRIHFNSFSEAAICKDFLMFSKWTTIKLSFLLVHILNGRNEVDLRLKCALFNLESLASHSPFDSNLLW